MTICAVISCRRCASLALLVSGGCRLVEGALPAWTATSTMALGAEGQQAPAVIKDNTSCNGVCSTAHKHINSYNSRVKAVQHGSEGQQQGAPQLELT